VSVSPQTKGSGVPQAGRSYRGQEGTQIDTRNILFIVGGAFAGIEKFTEARTSRSAMGFRPHSGETGTPTGGPAAALMPSDLVKFGLIPEFIGRLPVITVLDELDRSALLQILTEPRNALVKQYELLFEMDGAKLEFEPGALEAIADEAMRRESGARGLRGIIEEVLIPVMYDLPSRSDVARVIVTEEMIRNRGGAVFLPADDAVVTTG
jgi:ATP-dependent Clp protease ATP-binding subunit ClpX